MTPHLVMFDCDGVLVDSEPLTAEAMRELVAAEGLSFSAAEALDLIRGRKVAEWVEELCGQLGRPLPGDFVPRLRARAAELYGTRLRPVPHVREVVAGLGLPSCVVSSAPPDKIRLTLGLTGLLPYFGDRIYSAYEVGVWKPDPGLYRHAAQDRGVPPQRCAVVEDSAVGVRAGVAAGMTVFGYAPAHSGTEAALAAEGAVTFGSMRQLPGLLARWRTRPPAAVPAAP